MRRNKFHPIARPRLWAFLSIPFISLFFLSCGTSVGKIEKLKKEKNSGALVSLFFATKSSHKKEMIVDALIDLDDKSFVSRLAERFKNNQDSKYLESNFRHLIKSSGTGIGSILSDLIETIQDPNVLGLPTNPNLMVVIMKSIDNFAGVRDQLGPSALALLEGYEKMRVFAIPHVISDRRGSVPRWTFTIDFYSVCSQTIYFNQRDVEVYDPFSPNDRYIAPTEYVSIDVRPFGHSTYKGYWVFGAGLLGRRCLLIFKGDETTVFTSAVLQ